jgi:hypothetical protein
LNPRPTTLDLFHDPLQRVQDTVRPLVVRPVSFAEACAFISRFHRHHAPPQGHKWSLSAWNGHLCGVAVVGRPVARMADNGLTLEVTRLCTDGARNACSCLYAAAARAAQAMGYEHIITYILASESGASLRAAGWEKETDGAGGTWSRPSRGRKDGHPLEAKERWGRWLVPHNKALSETNPFQ